MTDTQEQLNEIMKEIDGEMEYSDRDRQIMHCVMAGEQVRKIRTRVEEILYMNRYYDRPITREQIESLHAELTYISKFFS